MIWEEKHRMKPKHVYSAIFATSVAYAPLLSWWKRADPISYQQTTWLQTVIGCGHVLLYLRLLLDGGNWLRVAQEAIMRLGEIITQSRTIIERLPNLSRAIDTGNILLGDALVNETRTRIQLIIEIAASAQTTLENAPAGDEANAQDVD